MEICQQNFHMHHREPIRRSNLSQTAYSNLSQTAYCLLVHTVVQSLVIHIQCSVTLAALWHCIWQSVNNEFYFQTWWYDAFMYRESWTKLVTFMAFSLENGIIVCWFSASMVTSDVCNANKSKLQFVNTPDAFCNALDVSSTPSSKSRIYFPSCQSF